MRCLISFLLTTFLCSYSLPGAKLVIINPSSYERMHETVEIEWTKIVRSDPDIDPSNVVVTDMNGRQVPSQVIFEGNPDPQSLIFQVSLKARGRAEYILAKGIRERYPSLVYGRLVPERKDDFAWENNKIAFRVYGPALEATGEISNGIDVWVKRTSSFILNAWYTKDDYHKDHGEGLDGYTVGRTLGAGAPAPWFGEKLWLGNNFTSARLLDSGPVRITVCFWYAPYKAGNAYVREERFISLDAHSQVNRIRVCFQSEELSIPLVAGIVLREGGSRYEEAASGIIGYWEPETDQNGHMALGVIFPQGALRTVESEGHLLMISSVHAGESFLYYSGAGWSKSGFSQPGDWFEYLAVQCERFKNPFIVTF